MDHIFFYKMRLLAITLHYPSNADFYLERYLCARGPYPKYDRK